MKIIGITGTNGSGKGTVAQMLVAKLNLEHVSARDIIINYAKESGIDITDRVSMNKFSEKNNLEGWSVFGGFIKENLGSDKIYLLESIRRVKEIKEIRSFDLPSIIISIDADIETRFERILGRKSSTDNLDFQKFKDEEEMENKAEEDNQMNLSKCIDLVDFKFENNSNVENLERQIDKMIKKFPDFF